MNQQLLQKADDFFISGDYSTALHFYSNILNSDPEDQDAQIGLLLADMAMNDNEDKAQTLFDYYIIIKGQDEDIAYDTINNLIHEDNGESLEAKMDTMDGISFADFEMIISQEDIKAKEVFANIIFSTKLIITTKQEFLDFILLLMKHNFDHMILNYLENFIITFGHNESSLDIANTLSSLENDFTI